jgi:hypothetical protein
MWVFPDVRLTVRSVSVNCDKGFYRDQIREEAPFADLRGRL